MWSLENRDFFFLKHWHNNQTTKGAEVFKNTRSRDSVLSQTLPKSSSLLKLIMSLLFSLRPLRPWRLRPLSTQIAWRLLEALTRHLSASASSLLQIKGLGSVTRQQRGQRTSRLYRLSCEYGKLINRNHSVITGTTGRGLDSRLDAHVWQHTLCKLTVDGNQVGTRICLRIWKGGRHTRCNVWNAECFHCNTESLTFIK